MSDPDADLVRRLRERDQTAFDEVVRLHRGRIFSFAMKLIHDAEDAEEITQDTLLVAWTRIHQFKGDSPLFNWLMCIAKNRSFNRYNWKRRRGSQVTVSMQQEMGDNGLAQLEELVPSTACSVQREAEIAEFQHETTALFARLSYRHREVMMLLMLGYTYERMARELGTLEGTIKSRVARARQTLAALMDERDPALRDLRAERPA